MSRVNPHTGEFIPDELQTNPNHTRLTTIAARLREMDEYLQKHNYEETYDEQTSISHNDEYEEDPESLPDLERFVIDHNHNQTASQIINIRKKYEQVRNDRNRKKEQLLKDLQAIGTSMQELEEQERSEIARVAEENLQKRIKENEDYLLEQFEPLFNQDLVKFGMAVATLLRLGVYSDYQTLVREEAKKTGAYIRDQVFKTIKRSAKYALYDHGFDNYTTISKTTPKLD